MNFIKWTPLAYRQPNFSGAAHWWMHQRSESPRSVKDRISLGYLDWRHYGFSPAQRSGEAVHEVPSGIDRQHRYKDEVRRETKAVTAVNVPIHVDNAMQPDVVSKQSVDMDLWTDAELNKFNIAKIATLTEKLETLETLVRDSAMGNDAILEENASLRENLDLVMRESTAIVKGLRAQASMEKRRAEDLSDELAQLRRAHQLLRERNAELEKSNRQYISLVGELQLENHKNILTLRHLEEEMNGLRRRAGYDYSRP
jgi:hypothetical protein